MRRRWSYFLPPYFTNLVGVIVLEAKVVQVDRDLSHRVVVGDHIPVLDLQVQHVGGRVRVRVGVRIGVRVRFRGGQG